MAKILGATKLRTGALTRRAGALSLRKAVLPSSEAAGLKFRRVFMWVMQNRVDANLCTTYPWRPEGPGGRRLYSVKPDRVPVVISTSHLTDWQFRAWVHST